MICGKAYPYCHTNRPDITFRWQDVACCPDHAEQYFTKLLKDRGEYDDGEKVAQMQSAIEIGRDEYAQMNK